MTRKVAAMSRIRTLLTTLALLAVAHVAQAQGYKVVAHPSTPATSLSKSHVSRLFLKKVTSWSDGTAVTPVDQDRTSRIRQAFSADVHRKDPDAVAAYWQKQIFSGRGVPPVVKSSDGQVLAFIRSTPGAVGYVSAGASTSGVKSIDVE
jgi:ABC-type phosphate transport system substrate-binding protein